MRIFPKLTRVIASVLLILAGGLSPVVQPQAAPLLDQNCCALEFNGLTIEGVTRAQTFTVGRAGALTSLRLVASSPAAGSLSIDIYGAIHAGDTLATIGPILASGKATWTSALNDPNCFTNCATVTVDLSAAGLQVAPGQVLSFVERPTPSISILGSRRTTTGTLWTGPAAINAFNYAGGVLLTLLQNVFQQDPNPLTGVDLVFSTFVDPAPIHVPFSLATPSAVPLPGSAGLLMAGLPLVAWRLRARRTG